MIRVGLLISRGKRWLTTRSTLYRIVLLAVALMATVHLTYMATVSRTLAQDRSGAEALGDVHMRGASGDAGRANPRPQPADHRAGAAQRRATRVDIPPNYMEDVQAKMADVAKAFRRDAAPELMPFGGSWFSDRSKQWKVRAIEPWLPPALYATSDRFNSTPLTSDKGDSDPDARFVRNFCVGGESGCPDFPKEWLDNFSKETLQESQRQANKWAAEIAKAARFDWRGYVDNAMGFDEFNSASGIGRNWVGAAVMVYDSLGTLWLLGLHDDFFEASKESSDCP
eukprot:GHVU01220930.1.p1 GENE.GHVU01220930.1~~GHVU01220930.1.p1  ORF type:complete len:283 (-),score=30.28 GHVU01220930.1:288-1136(-)